MTESTDWPRLSRRNQTVMAHLQRLFWTPRDRAARRFVAQQRAAYLNADRALARAIRAAVNRDVDAMRERWR